MQHEVLVECPGIWQNPYRIGISGLLVRKTRSRIVVDGALTFQMFVNGFPQPDERIIFLFTVYERHVDVEYTQ